MFERFTDEARHVVVQAQEEARRLGHNYIGCEHLLLAAARSSEPAAEILREHGVTAERVEAVLVRNTGRDSATGPADRGPGLDREALAAIGIDLDVVRDRIEAAFGPNALDRAVLSPRRAGRVGRRPPWRKDLAAGLRHARGSRPARRVRLPGPAPQAHPKTPLFPGRAHGGHIPFTPRAKKSLELSLRQALAQHDNYIGLQHLVLALLTSKDGTPRRILADLGASPDALRAAILDRYRKAS
jgi:Clp amino terminal domain, pathogenicity island component